MVPGCTPTTQELVFFSAARHRPLAGLYHRVHLSLLSLQCDWTSGNAIYMMEFTATTLLTDKSQMLQLQQGVSLFERPPAQLTLRLDHGARPFAGPSLVWRCNIGSSSSVKAILFFISGSEQGPSTTSDENKSLELLLIVISGV